MPSHKKQDPIVRVAAGAVRGRTLDGVHRYIGIPYAASPVGDRRFASPAPPLPWAGVRDVVEPGANAPQRIKSVPGLDVTALIGAGWIAGDDYLTLNVWRPDDDRTQLPVMVFVHGGGFLIGSKDAPVQDGATFARDGVVCVAINYRLGIDGFLPIPGVPTNLGLRDVIAALQWVQTEIGQFGGDAANVTVFGESAGAMAIADLVTSPLAQGLFARAIIQSGHGGMTRGIGTMQRLVIRLAALLGVQPTRDGFAGVGPVAMLDAVEKVSLPTTRIDLRGPDGREPVFGISRFVPVHGDDVLPVPPLDALAAGAGAAVEVLIGTNAEEMNLYLVPSGVRDRIGRLLSWFVLRKSQPRAWAALKAYGAGKRPAGRALTDAMTDLVFRWPARRFAEEHRGRTHVYELEWRSPAFGGELGAAHAIDVPFVFDTLTCATGLEGLLGPAPPQDIATHMHRLWVDFARDGSLPWAPFDRSTRQVYRIGAGAAAFEPVMPAAAFLP
ncbi:carboxylesterase/lipase family protein [Sphingomonas mollis]|uniref:Carboxylic ester hydrolase n=1 Tax=Sphingomonas mollis TaxID=2795726 RepID=A0ABS0XLF3_9SPHN|nr:carboxylesterase family protein [Sphingomonas sp. BT553]MBJ6120859.1 carboxylesterase/lipase family protein [Sphingomonas sp. BT553]